MGTIKEYVVGEKIPPITHQITQEKINLFEACAIAERQNVHNDAGIAAQRFGTSQPIASGRMSIAYASEALRRFLGPEAFNTTGKVNLKFLRPVKQGDSVLVRGEVTEVVEEAGGRQVTVEVRCENQNGDLTAVGQGTALLPL